MQYKKTATDLTPLYKSLIDKHAQRIVIYSGDTDGCVPYSGTQTWIRTLNNTVTNDW